MIAGMPGTPPPSHPSGRLALPSPGQALAACHVAVLLFGFAGLFGKWIAWDATAIVLGRTLVAAVALAVVIRVVQGRVPKLEAGAAGNGVILAVHWTAFFAAIQASTVAIGLLGFASFPLFVPVFERALLGAKITAAKAAAMLLVSLGLVLVVPDVAWGSALAQGLAWGILSGATFAWLTVRTQRLVARHRASGIALWQNAVAAALLLPVVILRAATGWQRTRREPARRRARGDPRHRMHRGRAYTVRDEPRARERRGGGGMRGAGAGVRRGAGLPAAGRGAGYARDGGHGATRDARRWWRRGRRGAGRPARADTSHTMPAARNARGIIRAQERERRCAT